MPARSDAGFGSALPSLALGEMRAGSGCHLTPELLVGNTSRLLDLAPRLIYGDPSSTSTRPTLTPWPPAVCWQ